MTDDSVPTTRFKVTDDREGCTKLTVALPPIEKLCQLMAARLLLWFTVRVLAVLLMVAAPAVTLAPPGKVLGAGTCWAKAAMDVAANKTPGNRAPTFFDALPMPLADSETATKACDEEFQTRR